jgi:hypothetical protein
MLTFHRLRFGRGQSPNSPADFEEWVDRVENGLSYHLHTVFRFLPKTKESLRAYYRKRWTPLEASMLFREKKQEIEIDDVS